MRLTDQEQAMRAGELGPAVQWAMEHQIKVGEYLGAADFVAVSQAHIMADTESLGTAGVELLERIAALPLGHMQERVSHLTHSRRARLRPAPPPQAKPPAPHPPAP